MSTHPNTIEYIKTSENCMVSIVLCTRGRPRSTLIKCIKSLYQQRINQNLFEIVIVDGNDDNRIEEVITKMTTPSNIKITHLHIRQPQSMIAARHNAIMASKGKFIAFIDDDCVAENSWIFNLLECINSNGFDGLQGQTLCLNQNTYMENFAEFDESQRKPSYDSNGNIFNISTVNAMYRGEILCRMDFHRSRCSILEKAEIYIGFEDYLITQEALKLGANLGYCSKAIVYHAHPSTLYKKLRQFVGYGRNAYGYCWITQTDFANLPGYPIPSKPSLIFCLRNWIFNTPRLKEKYRIVWLGKWTIWEKITFPIVCSLLELSYLMGVRACAKAIGEADV